MVGGLAGSSRLVIMIVSGVVDFTAAGSCEIVVSTTEGVDADSLLPLTGSPCPAETTGPVVVVVNSCVVSGLIEVLDV